MKNLNVPQPLSGGSPVSRFQAAKAMAYMLALADPELIGPEPEGCSGPFVNIRDALGNERICRVGGQGLHAARRMEQQAQLNAGTHFCRKGDRHAGYQSNHQ